MDLGELMGAAPRIRMRSVDERQRGQLAELAVLNERLAGRQSWQIRQKLEHLKSRRRIWELIYEYVTKRDAIASLAMIEEANNKVGNQRNNLNTFRTASRCTTWRTGHLQQPGCWTHSWRANTFPTFVGAATSGQMVATKLTFATSAGQPQLAAC